MAPSNIYDESERCTNAASAMKNRIAKLEGKLSARVHASMLVAVHNTQAPLYMAVNGCHSHCKCWIINCLHYTHVDRNF